MTSVHSLSSPNWLLGTQPDSSAWSGIDLKTDGLARDRPEPLDQLHRNRISIVNASAELLL